MARRLTAADLERLSKLATATGHYLADRRQAVTLVADKKILPALPARAERPGAVAARALNRASGLLAFAALADSGVEHYRGSFHNKTMYVPLVVATAALLASLHGSVAPAPRTRRARSAAQLAALAAGIVGTGFHFYNIGKRPGRFSWLNLFYAAPLGAPASLSLAGLFGLAAERLRAQPADRRVSGIDGRVLAALAALGLAGTSAEAALLHFRGAYHNPAMFLPVTLPPVGAGLLAAAALNPAAPRGPTRWWMRLLVVLGLAGSGFHAYGVQRNMGGWRNWSQNILNGPPLPAPPAFTALALVGLAALRLLDASRK